MYIDYNEERQTSNRISNDYDWNQTIFQQIIDGISNNEALVYFGTLGKINFIFQLLKIFMYPFRTRDNAWKWNLFNGINQRNKGHRWV